MYHKKSFSIAKRIIRKVYLLQKGSLERFIYCKMDHEKVYLLQKGSLKKHLITW